LSGREMSGGIYLGNMSSGNVRIPLPEFSLDGGRDDVVNRRQRTSRAKVARRQSCLCTVAMNWVPETDRRTRCQPQTFIDDLQEMGRTWTGTKRV